MSDWASMILIVPKKDETSSKKTKILHEQPYKTKGGIQPKALHQL